MNGYRTIYQEQASKALKQDVYDWLVIVRKYGLTWKQARIELAERGGPLLSAETLRRWDYFRRCGR